MISGGIFTIINFGFGFRCRCCNLQVELCVQSSLGSAFRHRPMEYKLWNWIKVTDFTVQNWKVHVNRSKAIYFCRSFCCVDISTRYGFRKELCATQERQRPTSSTALKGMHLLWQRFVWWTMKRAEKFNENLKLLDNWAVPSGNWNLFKV